ncbi:cellulose binding domain-containing protein [Actinomadura scrupuli]|uniref:cellulose binding domain-containing protein n=1 Tax=Actinomadura scrupuli TaxID=559629 RepID=UPI003D996A26
MGTSPQRSRRRRVPGRGYFLAAGLVASFGLTVAAWAVVPGQASAESIRVTYAKVSDWGSGHTAQYTLTNTGTRTVHGWHLAFDLPAGARITSMWDGVFTASGAHVTVRNAGWNGDLDGGGSAVVGFVVEKSRGSGDPAGCTINGSSCAAGPAPAPTASGRPTGTPGTAAPTPTRTPTRAPAPRPVPTRSPAPAVTPAAGTARFAPYVDTGLFPAFDLTGTAAATGVEQFNLAFVVSGGGCTPTWGGVEELGANAVARQIGALRRAGGDVRVSFGGANGTELAGACSTVGALTAAYQKVVGAFGLTMVDFDVEGAALPDTAANDRRARAVAALQKANPGLKVSFTLPVLPQGLTQDGVDLLADARDNGVDVDAVNIMAMDYGDWAAPDPAGRMGDFAIDAATATHSQIKGVFKLGDAQAWHRVAVTPMIGVNDTSNEIFTVADARKVAAFAAAKGLAWTSMWSATRDKACPGGAKAFADATCSSVVQQPLAFSRALAG